MELNPSKISRWPTLTSPIGIVVRYKHGHWRKDRALIYWTDTCKQVWHGVWRLERLLKMRTVEEMVKAYTELVTKSIR